MSTPRTLIALPGLHGSAALFAPLLASRPPGVEMRTFELPVAELSYAELATHVAEQLPRGEPFSLLAESFSGPLALLAAQHVAPSRLILCATFVRSPFPPVLARLPWTLLARLPLPTSAIALALTGGDRRLAREVRREVDRVPPRVIASRIRATLRADVRRELRACPCRVLSLQAARDRLIPASAVGEMLRARPDARVARIDAPHLLLQMAPREAWREITEFLGTDAT
jgi:pimeloyl-ACP methyl ester carboxylesterase